MNGERSALLDGPPRGEIPLADVARLYGDPMPDDLAAALALHAGAVAAWKLEEPAPYRTFPSASKNFIDGKDARYAWERRKPILAPEVKNAKDAFYYQRWKQLPKAIRAAHSRYRKEPPNP